VKSKKNRSIPTRLALLPANFIRAYLKVEEVVIGFFDELGAY